MQIHTVIQALLTGVVASGCIAMFFMGRRAGLLFQNAMETVVTALKHDNLQDYSQLSQVLVDLKREHESLKAKTDHVELQQTDFTDMMNRRFARLSTRMTRELKEGEEAETPADVEVGQQLIDQLEPGLDDGYAEATRSGRRRLVRRSVRRYGRR